MQLNPEFTEIPQGNKKTITRHEDFRKKRVFRLSQQLAAEFYKSLRAGTITFYISSHTLHVAGYISVYIMAKRVVRLSPELAAEFYKSHYGHNHFPHLVAHMSSGIIAVYVIAAKNCIQKWRTLMGPARVAEAQAYWPDSLRACYGRRTKYGDYFNGLHGSETPAEAIREIHFFFPKMIVGPMLRTWQIADYIQKNITPTLVPGLTKLSHERPAEPILWLSEYLRLSNPNEPEIEIKMAEIKDDDRCITPLNSEESFKLLQ